MSLGGRTSEALSVYLFRLISTQRYRSEQKKKRKQKISTKLFHTCIVKFSQRNNSICY